MRISGIFCARTGYRAACSPPTATSSITAATRGTASSTSPGSSCPSAFGTGPRHDDQRGLVLVPHRNADPPWTKPVADSAGRRRRGRRFSMVRASPRISWTRGTRSTPDCARAARPGSALFRLSIQGCPAPAAQWMEGVMEVLYPRCAGLDVHKDTVVAARPDGRRRTGQHRGAHVRHHHAGAAGASGWLAEYGCTHVAMEATGVYWKPVWHILSDGDVHPDPGQRGTREERARPQDRCGRRGSGWPICWRTA